MAITSLPHTALTHGRDAHEGLVHIMLIAVYIKLIIVDTFVALLMS